MIRELFHPTFMTSDRDRLAERIGEIFGVPSMYQREFGADPRRKIGASYPTDYVLLSWIGDLWWYAADPSRMQVGNSARAERPSDGLSDLAFKVDAEPLIDRFLAAGARLWDLAGEPVSSLQSMAHPISPDTHFLWTDAGDTGLSFELVRWPADRPGYAAGWKYPPPGEEDPLGLVPPTPSRDGVGVVRSHEHIIVTDDLGRARRTMVDLFGGHDLGADHFALAGTRIRYVTPESVPAGMFVPLPSLLGRPQFDLYYGIALEVGDLAQARRHLESVGARPRAVDGSEGFWIQPDDCLGMRWQFVPTS